MKHKVISIIIATYNVSDSIQECLSSVITQKYEECELLVIDGASTDATVSIISSFGSIIDVFVSEQDLGVYDAWNKGIEKAKGEWIMFLGADDILLPNAIKDYLEVLKNRELLEDVDYICATNEYVDKNNKLIKIIGKEPKWSVMRKVNVAAHVASLHNKTQLFNKLGFYDLNFKICADYELLLRKKENLRYLFIPIVVARMRTGGMSFSNSAIIETYQIRKKHHTVSYFENIIITFFSWILFKLFILRKL